jgi:glucokinase
MLSMNHSASDARVVMTLDAGGTNFVFSALRGNLPVVEPFTLPACAGQLERSLENIIAGFRRVQAHLPAPPAAISFAFPGLCLGGGLVRDGQLILGDNSAAGEVWLLRHKLDRGRNAEEGASIRAVRRTYAAATGIPFEQAPDPKTVFEIAEGRAEGNRAAAREAFRLLGEVAGDAIAEATTLLDGLVVIGGGIAQAHRQFLPALVGEMNGSYTAPDGTKFPRLVPRTFNLEDAGELARFLAGETKDLTVPGSGRRLRFDAMPRIGVGISRLGASEATAIGAYAFALSQLDRKGPQ